MASAKTQSFENHTRTIPAYHFLAFGFIAVNLLWSLYRAAVAFSMDTVVSVFVAVALILIFFFARVFALRVQDRVIRLEMRLRLNQIVPADLKGRVNDFTVGQLCALRFADDAELPDLARTVLTDNIQDRTTIRKMIKTWNADWIRA